MKQFTVPQFIDVEDKILGPLTIRQFLIILGGAIIIFLAFRFGDLGLFIIVLIVVGILVLAFAFVKINGQPFHYFLLNLLQTSKKPSLRVWRKDCSNMELEFYRKQGTEIKIVEHVEKKPVKRQHIRDLSLVVNTGGYYKAEK